MDTLERGQKWPYFWTIFGPLFEVIYMGKSLDLGPKKWSKNGPKMVQKWGLWVIILPDLDWHDEKWPFFSFKPFTDFQTPFLIDFWTIKNDHFLIIFEHFLKIFWNFGTIFQKLHKEKSLISKNCQKMLKKWPKKWSNLGCQKWPHFGGTHFLTLFGSFEC